MVIKTNVMISGDGRGHYSSYAFLFTDDNKVPVHSEGLFISSVMGVIQLSLHGQQEN